MKFFPDKNHPIDVKIIHQGVDTLVTSHIALDLTDYATRFHKFIYFLTDLKDKAQETVSFSQDQRFTVENIYTFGKFKIYAQGKGAYTFILENEDLLIFVGTHKYGANGFNTPQIRIEYRAHYLFSAGHKKAYEYALKFVSSVLGDTKNHCSRIDLATDVQGIKYTSFDKYRLQSNYRKTEFKEHQDIYLQNYAFREYLKHNKTTGFHIGGGDFLFRIYDKTLEIKTGISKSYVITKWILNGYDKSKELPVWRHEIQYRRKELQKFMPKDCMDEVLFHFSQLDKLWNNAITKVRWTDLTNDEIMRISEDGLKSDSIKKIFQRARQNPERIDFWNILKNWDNKLADSIVKYKEIKEPKIQTAKKFYKAFLGATYKAMGNNPQNLLTIHEEVEQDLKELSQINLQDFAELKVLSSFVENAKMIDETGYVYEMDYSSTAFVYYKKLLDKLKSIDDNDIMNNARRYFEHKGLIKK